MQHCCPSFYDCCSLALWHQAQPLDGRLFQIPDLANSDFFRVDFLTFCEKSGTGGRPTVPDVLCLPDFGSRFPDFFPDFLCVPMCGREDRLSLPGNNMILQKCVTTRQPWAQWWRCGDDDVLRRNCLCGIDNAYPPLLPLLALLSLCCFLCCCRSRCLHRRLASSLPPSPPSSSLPLPPSPVPPSSSPSLLSPPHSLPLKLP